jgi:hypothetical protein
MFVVFHIEPIFDYLLYVESIVTRLVLLLTIVQLFDDILLFVCVIITLMSLVAVVVITNLM